MRLTRILALNLLTMLFASTLSATTYYVSTTGDDTAAGSIDAPFRTITKAAQVATAGDVVNVRGGIHTERAIISSRGTAAAPIVFRSMAGELAILDGVNTPSNKGIIELVQAEHVEVSGFEVRNAPHIGIVVWIGRNIRVLDNHVHHAYKNGIYVGGETTPANFDITVSGNRVHDTVLINEFHTFPSGGWPGAVVVSRTDRATITGNRIFQNYGEGLISLRSNYHVIEGNEISDSFSMNLYFDNSRFATANGNLIYSTGDTRFYRNGVPAAGIAVANETKDVMNPSSDNSFTNNIVIGTRWAFYYGAYESGGGLRNTRVLNNTFYGSVEAIIRIEDDTHANSVVANNIFYPTGSPTPTRAGMGLVTYQKNLWYGGTAGPAAGTGDIIANPLLSNPGGFAAGNYKLTALSPAIASGVAFSGVTADFWGTTRASAFDIGAHQYATPVPPVPDTDAPTAPASVSATPSASAPAIALAWTPSSDNVGVTAYRIFRNGALVATVSGTTWTDSGLAWATTYSFGISAVDAAGNVSPATPASATTIVQQVIDTLAPTTPADFRVSASSSSTSMELGWTASTDNVGVAGYKVYRNGTQVSTVTGTTWTDTGLRRKTKYTWAVSAIDAAGNESGKNTDSARTGR